MVAGEKERFVVGLRALASTFRTELTDATIEGYWMALEELELVHVGMALRRALKESRFFPPPAELLGFGRHAKTTTQPFLEEPARLRLSAVERKRVAESWGNREQLSNAKMLEGCYVSLHAAKKKLEELLELERDLPIGDPARNPVGAPSLFSRIATARGDVEHWEGYVVFWRGRCVDEGDDQVAGTVRINPTRRDEGEERIRQLMNDPAFFEQLASGSPAAAGGERSP
jgi:hypothetical protein